MAEPMMPRPMTPTVFFGPLTPPREGEKRRTAGERGVGFRDFSSKNPSLAKGARFPPFQGGGRTGSFLFLLPFSCRRFFLAKRKRFCIHQHRGDDARLAAAHAPGMV